MCSSTSAENTRSNWESAGLQGGTPGDYACRAHAAASEHRHQQRRQRPPPAGRATGCPPGRWCAASAPIRQHARHTLVWKVGKRALLHQPLSQQVGGVPLQHRTRQLDAPRPLAAQPHHAHDLAIACGAVQGGNCGRFSGAGASDLRRRVQQAGGSQQAARQALAAQRQHRAGATCRRCRRPAKSTLKLQQPPTRARVQHRVKVQALRQGRDQAEGNACMVWGAADRCQELSARSWRPAVASRRWPARRRASN